MTLQVDTWEHRLLAQAYAPFEGPVAPFGKLRHAPSPYSLSPSYDHCRVITRQHSRTFALAAALLPPPQRRAIWALYAFCRTSDDLVDRAVGLGPDDRAARLAGWRQRVLHPQPGDDDPVVLAWADARARYHIPRQYAEQLLDGVAGDLTPARYDTFADLAHYCYAVASTVGLMVIHIIGHEGPAAIPYAVKLGVALQLTNILRDVGEDWRNGRLYLPREELAAFGLDEADVARGQVDDRWRAFMAYQIARARRLYDEALPGVALLGRDGRFAIRAAAELYRAILDDIEAHDYDPFTRRAHTSDWRKLTMLPGTWNRTR